MDIGEFLCFNVKIKIRISYSHWFRRTSYHIKKGFSSMLKIDIHCQHNDGSVKPTTYYPLKTRCEIMRYWRGKYLFLFIKRRGKLLTAIFKVKLILLLSSAARFLLHICRHFRLVFVLYHEASNAIHNLEDRIKLVPS